MRGLFFVLVFVLSNTAFAIDYGQLSESVDKQKAMGSVDKQKAADSVDSQKAMEALMK
jgi:hypothetical protein